MVTPELLDFIHVQLLKPTSPATVRAKLLSSGYSKEDIDAAFLKVAHIPPGKQGEKARAKVGYGIWVGLALIIFCLILYFIQKSNY